MRRLRKIILTVVANFIFALMALADQPSVINVMAKQRWMDEGWEYDEHLIFFEDFERDTMGLELTAVGTFPNPASVQDGMGVDGSRGFGFGRSDATGSAWGKYMNTLTCNLNNRYFITKVEFDEMERYGNYGSRGYVIVNLGENEHHTGQYGRLPDNDNIADSTYRHCAIDIGMLATNISLRVWDITKSSEEFVDNVRIYGRLAREWTIALEANGGVGEMDTQAVIEGDVLTLASNRFVRTGYAFQGWSTVAYGAVEYADGATILDMPAEKDRLTFYAVWKPYAPEIFPTEDTIFLNAAETVTLSHDADDVIILYTKDGSDPVVNGHEYKGAFAVCKSCTIKAVAYGAGRYSGEVSVTLTRADNLGEAANLYGYTMETGASAAWTVDEAVSHDGVSSIRSNGSGSYVQASVRGAGTLSFWWRAQCEEPDDGEFYDYGAFKVGSAGDSRIAGNDTGWVFFSTNVTTTGKHTLRWEYRKDDEGSYQPDCVWVDQVQWVPADGSGYTLTTPEPVPYSWLTQYNLGVAEGDFEAAANAANGKMSWGRPMSVWQDYVVGTDPTNLESKLTAKIEMQGGFPIVTWDPNLNTNGDIRAYKVYGSETLEDGGNWQYPTNSLHRFFKVEVEMP